MIKVWNIEPIIHLYIDGMSAQEIKDTLKLNISIRQIQRIVSNHGVSRSVGDAFRNAVSRGRVRFVYKKNKIKRHKLSPKLRYEILQRDAFKCVRCQSPKLLEVDHIDEDKNNNIVSNLQTLCHECNQGKSLFLKSASNLLLTTGVK